MNSKHTILAFQVWFIWPLMFATLYARTLLRSTITRLLKEIVK